MSRVLVRGLLALFALGLALAGQYFVEHRDDLNTGLYLLLLGGLALSVAGLQGPRVLRLLPVPSFAVDTTPDSHAARWLTPALLASLLLLAASLYRSASNPDDGVAWALYLASVAAFSAFLLGLPGLRKIAGRLRRRPRMPKAPTLETGLLLAILALAVFLRLLFLKDMPFGLWYDEAIHGMSAVNILEDSSYRPIFVPAANVASPMIFFQAVFVGLWGRNTVALRLPSVLMDLGLILMVYVLARRLLGPRGALVVAFLLAVSSWDITWARNAMPGVTTPFFAVATVLTFLWALKRGSLAAYGLAGMVLGSGLWFYQSFRVMPIMVVCLAAYALFRHRLPVIQFARRFSVYVGASILASAPLIQYSLTHSTEFWSRARVVTSSQTGSPTDAVGFLWDNLNEYLLMFNFLGDVNGRHNLPNEPMLSFGVAALAVLGFLYCLSRPHKPVAFLLLVWFAFSLLPGLVTLPFEAPNTLRVIGTLPVAYLFAGVAVVTIWGFLAPLVPGRKGLVLVVPLLAGLGGIAYDNYHTYFDLQRNSFEVWSAFNPVETAIAYELLDLPSRDYDVQLTPFLATYPVITFLVPDGPRLHTFEPGEHPPATTGGDGARMFLDTRQDAFLSRIKAFYPEQGYSVYDFGKGRRQPKVYMVSLEREDVEAYQGLTERIFRVEEPGLPALERRVRRIDLAWGDQGAYAPPFDVEWNSVLYVPAYGDYRLRLEGSGDVELRLDGERVLTGPGVAVLPLAVGNHSLVVTERVPDSEGRTRLSWTPPGGTESVLGSENLYAQVESRGLLGTYYPSGYPEASGAFQRIDPMVFFFFHRRPFSGEFSVVWEGLLEVVGDGTYGFKLDSSGPATITIDGEPLLDNPGIPEGSSASQVAARGSRRLSAGLHPITITFRHKYGSPQIYLHWSPPYANPGPLPWDLLRPAPPAPIAPTNGAD